MALDGDEVEDDDDRDMLLLSLLLCWNAALQRGPCDLPHVWVHVRVVESLSNWDHVAVRTSILRHCKC